MHCTLSKARCWLVCCCIRCPVRHSLQTLPEAGPGVCHLHPLMCRSGRLMFPGTFCCCWVSRLLACCCQTLHPAWSGASCCNLLRPSSSAHLIAASCCQLRSPLAKDTHPCMKPVHATMPEEIPLHQQPPAAASLHLAQRLSKQGQTLERLLSPCKAGHCPGLAHDVPQPHAQTHIMWHSCITVECSCPTNSTKRCRAQARHIAASPARGSNKPGTSTPSQPGRLKDALDVYSQQGRCASSMLPAWGAKAHLPQPAGCCHQCPCQPAAHRHSFELPLHAPRLLCWCSNLLLNLNINHSLKSRVGGTAPHAARCTALTTRCTG